MNIEYRIPNGILKIREWCSTPEININNKNLNDLIIEITKEINKMDADELIVDFYIAFDIKNPNNTETSIYDYEVE